MSVIRSPILWLALLVFVSVKIGWALLPVETLQSPRLGDDAQVYLWTGDASVLTPKDDSVGVESVRAIASAPSSDELAQYWRDRVGLRMTGVSASPLAIFTGALLHAGISPALTFALVEALTGLVLGVGIAAFLSGLVSRRAAAFALVLLAMALLPRQGLHFLVPSVFSLGVSMIAWGILLEKSNRTRAALAGIALACALAVSVHTIGKAYVAIALGLAVLAPSFANARLTIDLPRLTMVLIGGLSGLAVEYAPGTRPPASAVAASLDLTAFPDNALAFLADCATVVSGQPLLAIVVFIGVCLAIRKGLIDSKALAAIVTIGGAMLVAGLVILPEYKGELMSRMLGPSIILLVGLAYAGIKSVSNRMSIWATLCSLIIASQALPFAESYLSNLNGRWAVYDKTELARDLAFLIPGEPIVWLDSDIAMPAAFLAGAWSHPALPAATLDKDSAELAALEGKQAVFAGLPHQRLNSLSVIGSQSFDQRFYGWDFKRFSRIDIQNRGERMATPALRLVDTNTQVRISTFLDEAPCNASLGPVFSDGWSPIILAGCNEIDEIRIESDCATACPLGSLRGFSTDGANTRLDWPWNAAEILIVAHPRDSEIEPQIVAFSPTSFFAANGLTSWASMIKNPAFLSDRSGIVWMRATLGSKASPLR